MSFFSKLNSYLIDLQQIAIFIYNWLVNVHEVLVASLIVTND